MCIRSLRQHSWLPLQFQGAFPACRGEDTIPSPVSREESREIAREYDISQPDNRDYQGRNLTMAGTTPYDCHPCYEFAYTFGMQSIEDSVVVDRVTVRVSVRENRVTGVAASYGMRE